MIHGKILTILLFIFGYMGIPCCPGFSPVGASGGCSPVVCRLLIAVASPVAERGLQGAQASAGAVRGLSSCGSLGSGAQAR